jgi:hypothetical protein
MSGRHVCFYDANVLYSAQLRDFLMRLALGEVVQAHWTERVHEEWMRNIETDDPHITGEDLQRIRGLMDEALPEALTEGYEDRRVGGSDRRSFASGPIGSSRLGGRDPRLGRLYRHVQQAGLSGLRGSGIGTWKRSVRTNSFRTCSAAL